MKPGRIVEFASGDDHRLGAVVGLVGTTKLAVVVANGDEMRPSRDEVTCEFAETFDPAHEDEGRQATVALDEAAEELRATLDARTLWESALDAGHPLSQLQLTQLVDPDASDPARLAVLRTIRAETPYFKQSSRGIEPRAPEVVAALLQERSATRSADEARANFVAAILEILDIPAYQRASAFQEARRGNDFDRFAKMVERYAAHEGQSSDAEFVEHVIDQVAERLDGGLPSSGAGRGFDLLRELRAWDEHELLSVHRFGLAMEHEAQAEDVAQQLAAEGWRRENREDFTDWWTCTIDAADTADIDDALSIRPRIEGGWELAVHIADPTAYILPATDFDTYVQHRGTSVYLPTGAVPMIPKSLSEQAISLVAGVERPAITTHIVFDHDLSVISTRIVESVISVNVRYSYAEADALLESDSRSFFVQTLTELCYIADELHARRRDRGAVAIELPEPRIRVEFRDGEPHVEVDVAWDSPSRAMVSEMMVVVGERIAQWCFERDLPVVYRTQEAPDVRRTDPRIEAIPEGWAREYAVLRTMRRAEVSTRPSPHAGLGVSMYAQATSPIRRYGDLANQRQFKAVVSGEQPPYDDQTLFAVVQTVEKASYEASAVEREAARYWMLHHLARLEGAEVEAIVLDYHDESRLDAEVILKDFAWRARARLRSRASLGDEVRVVIDRSRPRAGQLALRER